jgi:hypothetical protein
MTPLVGIHVLQFLALFISKAVIYAVGRALAQRRWRTEHVGVLVVVMTARGPVKVGVVDVCIAIPERILGTR